MKIRIKFTKTGPLKYIGHLDVMRFFQKLLKRAQIPVAFSEGFSPHPILSFSPPLSLGCESLGEYADIEITSSVNSDDAIRRLNEKSVDGIEILSFNLLPEKSLNAMACVSAAEYICEFKEQVGCPFDFVTEFSEFMQSDRIPVIKKTKKSETEIDIKPLIYNWEMLDDSKLLLRLSAGSVNNLKPELVYRALFERKGFEIADNCLKITRKDLYCNNGDTLISLDDVGSKLT